MKTSFIKVILVLLPFAFPLVPAFGQSPEKMSYQAVIRNSSDALVTNTQIGMEINIRQGSPTGTIVYTETQTPTTNANGLVSIEIGGGTGFNTINWGTNTYFIETKTAVVPPLTTYTITGTSQLLSVPYALHSKTAETVISGITETDPIFTAWNKDYNDLTNTPTIPTVPSNVSAFSNDAGYLTSFTESQILTISNDTIYLTGGSFVKLPAGFNGQYSSLTGVPTEYTPATHNQAWSTITATPTTIAGYGITDAFDGNYNNLTNTPNIVDSINTHGFNRQYGNLLGVPTEFTPAAHNQAWSTITATPTTIAGYGITDAFNGTWTSLTGKPTEFTPAAHNQAWSTITSKPTTIAGYGITDAFNGNYNALTNKPVNATTTTDGFMSSADKIKVENLSGTNTGDNAVNSLYSSLVTNATHTGDVTGSGALTIANKVTMTATAPLSVSGSPTVIATSPVAISIAAATTSAAGSMSAADKTKLDGVATGTAAGQMQYWNGTAWVTVAPSYNGSTLTLVNGVPTWQYELKAGEVLNATTGKIWMDRNLGASQVATSSTDHLAYGDLFQWGRGDDGHQNRSIASVSGQSSLTTPTGGQAGKFLHGFSNWYNGSNPNDLWQGVSGTNNPCPSGYRLPTNAEWTAERLSWAPNINAAGAFASPLKLPVAGYRIFSTGSLVNVGSYGNYWSSTVSGTFARYLHFSSSTADMHSNYWAYGFSVRCIKD